MVYTIHIVAATRPNFMKVAPVYHELMYQPWCKVLLVHTDQHYDYNMSQAFFKDLGLPEPDICLGVGSGTHAEQTAGVMVAYERILLDQLPDCIIVVGDVNSTMACTLVAKKLNLMVAHLEAGLRSFDRQMPEEINRLVTDSLSDLLWIHSEDANQNLLREGIPEERIKLVGNIMIDSFERLRGKIEASRYWQTIGFLPKNYGVVTLHRPTNVDCKKRLSRIVEVLVHLSSQTKLVLPLHPRTRKQLEQFQLFDQISSQKQIVLSEPLSYIQFMSLVTNALFVITDSGGLQEETCYLGVNCLTLRETTERPITIDQGTNSLVKLRHLIDSVERIIAGDYSKGTIPYLWDGKTAMRVAKSLYSSLLNLNGNWVHASHYIKK